MFASKSSFYNTTQLKQRHKFVRPLKLATFKYSEIRRFGFQTSKTLWKGCFHRAERNLDNVQFLIKFQY
jgi:hypothetical protein